MSNLRVSLITMVGAAVFVLGPGAFDTLLAQENMGADRPQMSQSLPGPGNIQTAEAETTPAQPKNAAEWYDRGILLSVYGNSKAAIDAFNKVIELEPANSDAHFQLGVEYGTLGQYQQALTAIGQAIELNPQKPAFYYGRGWVLLLSGDKDKAIQDFEIAAQKGHPDAINYLRRQGLEPN